MRSLETYQTSADTLAERVNALRGSEELVVATQQTVETARNAAHMAVNSLGLAIHNLRAELSELQDTHVRIQTYEYIMTNGDSGAETTSVDRDSNDIPIIQGDLKSILSDARLMPGRQMDTTDGRPILRVVIELESKLLSHTYHVPIDAIKSIEKYP